MSLDYFVCPCFSSGYSGYLPFTHSEGWAELRSDGVQQAPMGTRGKANLSPLP